MRVRLNKQVVELWDGDTLVESIPAASRNKALTLFHKVRKQYETTKGEDEHEETV